MNRETANFPLTKEQARQAQVTCALTYGLPLIMTLDLAEGIGLEFGRVDYRVAGGDRAAA